MERKINEKCQVNELFSTYIHFESCTVNTSNYIYLFYLFFIFIFLFFYTFTLEVIQLYYTIIIITFVCFLLFEIFNVHHNNIVAKATLGCLNRGNQFITILSQFSPNVLQVCDSSVVRKVKVFNKKPLSVGQKISLALIGLYLVV